MEDTQAKRILILGARSISADVADWASDIEGVTVAGFVENENRERCGETFEGLPIHWIDDLPKFAKDHWIVSGLSTTKRRRFAEQAHLLGARAATLIHPSASVSKLANLAPGVLVNRGAIVAAHAHIGQHVILNRGASIGHHTTIGDFCTIQPGVTIAGACRIHESVYIGVGATIVDGIEIGERCFVTAHSMVRDDLPPRTQATGYPARWVRDCPEGL